VIRSRPSWCAALALLLASAACGKKGPPRPPLRLVPAAVTELSVRRLGADVHLRFTLPTTNANGPGQPVIERVDVYALNVAAGAALPDPAAVIDSNHLVGSVPARGRPAPDPAPGDAAGAQPPPAPAPGPGDVATFVDTLTAEGLRAPEPADPAAGEPSSQPARVYVVQPVGQGNRRGPPSRVTTSLAEPPPPPGTPAARVTETAIVLEWTAPPEASVEGYNVYAAGSAMPVPGLPQPLNPELVTATSWEDRAIRFGEERCYVVRSVATAGETRIESEPSARQCTLPVDVFAPAPPTGLEAVALEGEVGLIWNRNSETDLAGYLVLRGEAPGEKLQALTPAPIREASYRDTAVRAGVRYTYAIVAVDNATPPNQSGPSERVEVVGR
jgi:hypothetical protein